MLHHVFWLVVFNVVLFFGFSAQAQSSNPVGDAFASGGNCYTITANQTWQLGAVWFNEQVDLNQPVDISLTVYLGNNVNGADGIVMVFQQVGIEALGVVGAGMGFNGFSPSLGIELDTFQNFDLGDPIFDHVAIHQNGSVDHTSFNNLSGPVQALAGNPNLADGETHILRVTWNPETQLLSVYLDCLLRLTYSGDIVANIFANNSLVWWGFTGATGGLSNQQSACISNYALGLPANFELCQGDSIELGVVGAPDGDYVWEPLIGLSDPTISNPIAAPTETTTYTVTFTDLCGAETELVTTVEVVTVDVSLPDQVEACSGETINLIAEGNALTYLWSNGATGEEIALSESGIYTVEGSLGSCTSSASTNAIFHPPAFVDLLNEYSLCEGDTLDLEVSSGELSAYLWSNGETGNSISIHQEGNYFVDVTTAHGCLSTHPFTVALIPPPSSALPDEASTCEGQTLTLSTASQANAVWNTGETAANINVSSSGTYTVILEQNNCTTLDTIVVYFNSLPIFTAPEDISLCEDSAAIIPLPDLNYYWLWQGSPSMDTVIVTTSGTYILEAIDGSTGCSSSASIEVSPAWRPIIDLPNQIQLCTGGIAVINVSSINTLSYMWNTGENTPEIQVELAGQYSVVASNACGSTEAQIKVIETLCDCPVFIPNAFTPDSDYLNEIFKPVLGCEVDSYSFEVFNRWGNLIFSSSDPEVGWNGAVSGGVFYAQNDVFVWMLSFSTTIGSKLHTIERIGHVSLLR